MTDVATRIRQAVGTDVAVVSSILREAAAWLTEQHIPMWRTDELGDERIRADVEAGLFFLAEHAGEPAGTIKFQLSDPEFWPDVAEGESVYIHRLAVRRRFAGGEISSQLLQWAIEKGAALGRSFARLDCEASRTRLRAVYERAGFQHHSDRQVGPYFVSRYERGLPSRDFTTPPSPQAARIALIGDFDAAVEAHQAIPRALALACDATGIACDWTWIHTTTLGDNPAGQLAAFDGVWCVPASPYANTRGVLAAIRFARERGRPFLGTCGGFQYALLEYAEATWGIARPSHGELDPGAEDPLIAPLACSLVEESGEIYFTPESALATIYGVASRFETYHCRFGLNPRYAHRLVTGPLHVSGRDANGEVRAVELRGHPFFVATLFQPERSAWSGQPHPLILAFIRTVRASAVLRIPFASRSASRRSEYTSFK